MRKRVKEIEEMRELEKKAEEWRWRIQSQRSGDGGSNFLAQSGEQRSGDGGLAVAGSEKGEWGGGGGGALQGRGGRRENGAAASIAEVGGGLKSIIEVEEEGCSLHSIRAIRVRRDRRE
ncbi:unnamed protein product [Linum trigynum]|uniref:Uncharacterized protein n=1 Tax=Linum trigynum TaxID=586398 RepID=A0AAV2D382_9ROSI